jgi:hypothetical protein
MLFLLSIEVDETSPIGRAWSVSPTCDVERRGFAMISGAGQCGYNCNSAGTFCLFNARIVRHGRYAVFQLAEVAVPRALFADILRRIDDLRPRPPPLPA